MTNETIGIDVDEVRAKIGALLERLDGSFLERREHVRMALLSILAGHHVLFVGPPGTAKSLMARALCACVAETRYFEYLLSRFTHPDELFGPVSIPGLKREDYHRLTEGYLPQAHIAFLDEVFKANSAILNSLLTIINERVFHHGMRRDRVPLLSLIGASNELPDPEGVLAALFDRFLVRLAVPPLADDDNFLAVCLGEVEPFAVSRAEALRAEEIEALREASRAVRADEEVRQTLRGLRQAFVEEGVIASDRRWRQAMDLLKVAAVSAGRGHLSLADLLLLEHCFGCPNETDVIVRRIVRTALRFDESVIDLDWTEVEASWEGLRRPLPERPSSFADAVLARRRQLDDFTRDIENLSRQLNAARGALLADIESSPWTLEPPPETISGIIALRRRIGAARDAGEAFGRELASFSLVRHAMDRTSLEAREQGTSSRRFNFFYDDDEEANLWLSLPQDPPERWVPVEEGGALVTERRRRDQLVQSVERLGEGEWHTRVPHLPLGDDEVFALLYEETFQARCAALVEAAAGNVASAPLLPSFVKLVEGWRALDIPPVPSPAGELSEAGDEL